MPTNWVPLLFSFKGRIGRQVWWLTNLAVMIVVALAGSIIDAIARSQGMVAFDAETNQFEPTGVLRILLGVIGLINLWILYALSAKRLHDRDRTGWWLIAPYLGLAVAISLAFAMLSFPEGQREPWNTLGVLAFFGLVGLFLWLFYEIGFLRGTEGPNRFGPDPLAPSPDSGGSLASVER
jgi:uncharacterized membrane protein YhaH (DUF805 family)